MRRALLGMLFAAAAMGQVADGVVVDSLTGEPVAGARVIAESSDSLWTRTDATGHFRLATDGRLRVMRVGYAPARNIDGKKQRIEMAPQAVISGKVLDQDGVPVESVSVQALRYHYHNDGWELFPDASCATNDLGEYRLIGLKAGRYYLRFSGGNLLDDRYPSQYAGGGIEPDDDHRVEVKIGERRKLDVRLEKYDGVKIAGVLDGIRDKRHYHVSLSSGNWGHSYHSLYQREAAFLIRHVAPGRYTLSVHDSSRVMGTRVAEAPLEVGKTDVSGLVVPLHPRPGADVTGSIVLEGGGKLCPMAIDVRPARREGVTVYSGEDGSFTVKDLQPGTYSLQVQPDRRVGGACAQGGYHPIRSVRMGSKETALPRFELDGDASGPLRIVLGDPIKVNVKILDSSGRPVAGNVWFLPVRPGRPARISAASDGTLTAYLFAGDDYRAYVLPPEATDLDLDFAKAHENDFPVVRVAAGGNAPLVLRMP